MIGVQVVQDTGKLSVLLCSDLTVIITLIPAVTQTILPSQHHADKEERLRQLQIQAKSLKRKVNRLTQKIDSATVAAHVTVDEALDADLRSMASECTNIVHATYPEGGLGAAVEGWISQQSAFYEVAPAIHQVVSLPASLVW